MAVAYFPQSSGLPTCLKVVGCRLAVKSRGAYFLLSSDRIYMFSCFLLLLLFYSMPTSLSCSLSLFSGASWFCGFLLFSYSLTQWLLEGECWPFTAGSRGGRVPSFVLHSCLLAFLLSCSFALLCFALPSCLLVFLALCGVCVWCVVLSFPLAPCLDAPKFS